MYESDADASISWASLQAHLASPQDSILPGLKLIKENINNFCDADLPKWFLPRADVFVIVFAIISLLPLMQTMRPIPAYPNQAISVSIKYDPKPTYIALYDERTTANVINGFVETAPPYTDQPLATGNTFLARIFRFYATPETPQILSLH